MIIESVQQCAVMVLQCFGSWFSLNSPHKMQIRSVKRVTDVSQPYVLQSNLTLSAVISSADSIALTLISEDLVWFLLGLSFGLLETFHNKTYHYISKPDNLFPVRPQTLTLIY